MANTAVKDPLLVTWFGVEFQGKLTGAFQELDGLGSTNEVVELLSSTAEGKQIYKAEPGRLTWPNITLKRGVTDSLEFWKWREMVEQGKLPEMRTNGTITLYDEAGTVKAQWTITNAWPCNVSNDPLSSGTSAYLIETIELAHEGCKRTK